MDWNAIGAIGQWVGAFAVVVTLFYLAQQIRQQNQISRYGALKDLLDGFNQPNELMATNAKLRSVFVNGIRDPTSLSDEESGEFSFTFRLYYNHMLKFQRAYLGGLIRE